MKLLLATNNRKKLLEMRAILEGMGIEALSLAEAGINSEPEETGLTFEENARIKAAAALSASGLPSVADDSGLMVDALGGRPGVLSARYGGDIGDEGKCRLLLSELEGVPEDKRTARFVSSIVCLFPGGREISARGVCEGTILGELKGSGGFGYDPVFYIGGLGRTMAELSPEEKNKLSHRARALKEFAGKLEDIIYVGQ